MVNSSSNIPISTIYKIKPMQETVFIEFASLFGLDRTVRAYF